MISRDEHAWRYGAGHFVARLFVVCTALAILTIGIYAVRSPILTGMAEFLTVEDSLKQADVIFVLNGDVHTRPFRAAELYSRNLAPEIAMAKARTLRAEELGLYPNPTDVSVQVLQSLGLPDRAIRVLETVGGVASTLDEARVLRRFAAAQLPKRVIVVTAAHHTRRARWILRRHLTDLSPGVELVMAAARDSSFDESNWWKHEDGMVAIFSEYVKLAYYYVNYR